MTTGVTHTLTVSEASATIPADNKLAFNIEVLLTKKGLLKFFETVVGCICMVLIIKGKGFVPEGAQFSLAAVFISVLCCLLGTFLILSSYLISPKTFDYLPRTLFEFLHNAVSFIFFLGSSTALLILVAKANDEEHVYGNAIAVSVLGLVNSALYCGSSHYSLQSFRSQ